ncbi:MAG: hypothetical protein AAF098_01175 [Pseudomonadota bacterium]
MSELWLSTDLLGEKPSPVDGTLKYNALAHYDRGHQGNSQRAPTGRGPRSTAHAFASRSGTQRSQHAVAPVTASPSQKLASSAGRRQSGQIRAQAAQLGALSLLLAVAAFSYLSWAGTSSENDASQTPTNELAPIVVAMPSSSATFPDSTVSPVVADVDVENSSSNISPTDSTVKAKHADSEDFLAESVQSVSSSPLALADSKATGSRQALDTALAEDSLTARIAAAKLALRRNEVIDLREQNSQLRQRVAEIQLSLAAFDDSTSRALAGSPSNKES